MFNLKSKIYVAGHNGLVGSAIVRQLKKKGYKKLIFADRSKVDLTNQLNAGVINQEQHDLILNDLLNFPTSLSLKFITS